MTPAHSPADILRQALVDAGVGTMPTAAGAWPIFAAHLPDGTTNAICVYDTGGLKDGRLMTGATITHPGWQVRVRAARQPDAWAKMEAIREALDAIGQTSVAIDAATYKLAAVSQTGDILKFSLPAKTENTTANHEQITLNGTLTLKRTA